MQPKFTLENIMAPVWQGDTVYFESVMFVQEGGVAAAPLLWEPEEILAVQKADLTETYEPGRDYEYRDGKLYLTPGSRIFSFTREEFYPAEAIPGKSFPLEQGHLLFGEGHFFHDRQVAVTYRCKKTPIPGLLPPYLGQYLPRTVEKLQKQETVKIVLYGDSISEGANASGITGAPPFLPIWGLLVTQQLHSRYKGHVMFRNPSLGGETALWGAEHVEHFVCDENPDLVIVAFGANDGMAGEEYYRRIDSILQPIHRRCPQAEILLIATMVPNRLMNHPDARFNRDQDRQGLELAKFVRPGVAMVSMYEAQQALMQRKRFIDLTGNNVNHPNDFMVRMYAQRVCAALIPEFAAL